MAGGRGFQEISVTRLGVQTAVQRFGPDSTVHNPIMDDSDSEEEDEEELPNTMPRVEEWRMNLTALSQYHNLYFAAYGGKIYVYKPQGSQQVLPPTPLCILESAQSPEALEANLERFSAHIINHIMVGNLGNKEILLCSYDDGDVIAYYTDAIEDAHQITTASQIISVRPFFAENAGNSAWGLAIHQQSRLIAVGTNSHEVQVFAFALTPADSARPRCKRHPGVLCEGRVRFPRINRDSIPKTDDGHIARDHGFRHVFSLPLIGHNVPAVSFSDDVDGEADTIVAKDIRGALWFIRIWEGKWKRLPTIAEMPDPLAQPIMGWGVIVLPRNFFKPTYTPTETYGHPRCSITFTDFKVDISKSVQHVRDSTVWHEDFDDSDDEEYTEGDDKESEGGDVEDSETDPDVEVVVPETAAAEPVREDPDSMMNISDEGSTESHSMTAPAATFAPSASPSPPLESFPQSCEFDETGLGAAHHILTANRDISHLITSGALILHTNQHSITLIPSSDHCLPTHCDSALRQDFPHDAWFPRPLPDYDRLNMILTIPELSLVLVASQIGRVALITITRSVDRNRMLTGTVGMRVDLILPFSHEESMEKIRPSFGLLGMAVGPIQRERERAAARRSQMAMDETENSRLLTSSEGMKAKTVGRAAEEAKLRPRRWRLLLHYLNHAILSYELSRDEETDELMIL